MGPFSCVLFDLDGTVLDTNELIIRSFQHTFSSRLGVDLPAHEFYPYFGEPLKATMARYAPDRVEELLTVYREYNHTYHDELVRPFPGAFETIEALEREGIPLGVVTSKLRSTSHQGLKLFGLDKFMKVCVTWEDVQNHKPHPESVELALTNLGLGKQGVLLVGDSPQDLACARNAGIAAAAVGWSVHSTERLAQEQPQFFLNSFEELFKLCGIAKSDSKK